MYGEEEEEKVGEGNGGEGVNLSRFAIDTLVIVLSAKLLALHKVSSPFCLA